MQDYIDEVTEETRRDISKLTLEEDEEIRMIYLLAVIGIANVIKKNGRKLLNSRNVSVYSNSIKKARKTLTNKLEAAVVLSMEKAATVGSNGQKNIFEKILKNEGVKYSSKAFNEVFEEVDKYVVRYITKGTAYKDHKVLSARIWKYGEEFEDGINYMIDRAIKEGKSAIELAKDLEQFVKPSARRPSDWGDVYPGLSHKEVDYNAKRLARTSINHTYQESTKESSKRNPFIVGIEWISAYAHGRTCQLCMDRAEDDSYGLGAGIFPVDEVPLDHPNGLCSLASYIPQSMEEIGEQIGTWINGGEDNILDEWYKKHGEEFISI